MILFDRTRAVSSGEDAPSIADRLRQYREPEPDKSWGPRMLDANFLEEKNAEPFVCNERSVALGEVFASLYLIVGGTVPPIVLTVSYGGRSIDESDVEHTPWDVCNQRRWHLIEKDVEGTLTSAEHEELRRLQREADRLLSTTFPLPFELLRVARKQLQRMAGADDDPTPVT